MPNEVKQEPESSATMANEGSTETVNKAELIELRACKRKLEEIEPQFQENKRRLDEAEPELLECKRKLEEAESKVQKDKKKLEQFEALKALVATDVKFKPKRAKIALKLADFAKISEKFLLSSDPVVVAGFEWILFAGRCENEENADWMGLNLRAFPPAHYKGPFEIGIDFSFHLFNTFSSKDIHVEKKDFKMTRHAQGFGSTSATRTRFVEINKLLDPEDGFLQNDGSILLEADFTVKTTTLDHFLVDEADGEEHNNNPNEESGHEEN